MQIDPRCIGRFVCALLLVGAPLLLSANSPAPGQAGDAWLLPYTGPTRDDIDAKTLDGKVLCGYQGWFNTPGDDMGFGFTHWGEGLERTNGGHFTIDMWPDVSEYD